MSDFPFATRLLLAAEIERYGWTVGDHTYGQPRVMEPDYGTLELGRFCSIAADVTIVLGNHRMDMVSTYPFRTLFGFWPGAEHGTPDHEDRGGVTIGSDVWIGTGATILAGARVGHGAVLGAGTVVAGTVAPYAIVVGNPGRVVRKRFTEEVVARLLRIAWWDWPDEAVKAAIPLLTKPDIEAFLAAHDAA